MDTDNLLVTLNGKDVPAHILSLESRPEEPGPGDLLLVHGLPPIVLEDAQAIRLRDPGRETGLVLGQVGGGNDEHVMACRVGRVSAHGTYEGLPPPRRAGIGIDGDGEAGRVLANPLERLSAAECSLLRGIRLEVWDPVLEAQLARIDPGRCAFSIDGEVLRDCGGGLPPLPRELQYLVLDFSSWSSSEVFDLSLLPRFPELRALVFLLAPVDLDIGHVAGAGQLRVLHAPGIRVSGLSRLAELSELRELELDLSGPDGVDDDSLRAIGSLSQLRRLRLMQCAKLKSVEFVRPLQALEFIDLSGSAVKDLAPLADLPLLREVQAVGAAVRTLPERHLPNLRFLNVMNTPLEAEAVEAFRRRHPDARVFHGWAEALRSTVAGADRVRVRSGGTCHRDPEGEETLVEEADAAAIEALLRAFSIDEARSRDHCMCCGEPTIEFWRGGTLLAEIGLHHGQTARWEGWPGDARLTDRGRQRMAAWLSARGEHTFARGDG